MNTLNVGNLQEPIKSRISAFYIFISNLDMDTSETFEEVYEKYHRHSLSQLKSSMEHQIENAIMPN